ncbi:MAG: 30S ribosomal protein S17 [Sphingobacteriia bacterium]|nr:30S ribosomal protein S17 [Sphingobacteriia bacterium]
MPKRILQGVVVSTKSNKTAVVKVTRRTKHPKYGKTVTVSKKYAAHDENNSCKEGETVEIIETKPISKTKKWEIVQVNN